IEWYNELPGWERERVPQSKTLLSIASRMPKNAADLLRIKGVPPHFNKAHADTIVRGIHRAAREVDMSAFVQIDPLPYATFEDVRLEAWLTHMRAEVCAEVGGAPELLLPPRVMQRIKERVTQSGRREEATEALEGWRLA